MIIEPLSDYPLGENLSSFEAYLLQERASLDSIIIYLIINSIFLLGMKSYNMNFLLLMIEKGTMSFHR